MDRMYKLFEEVDAGFGLFILYGGMYDEVFDDIIPAEKIDMRNVNPRQASENMMRAYKSAIALQELCETYESSDFPKSERACEGVRRYKEIIKRPIEFGEKFIAMSLGRYREYTEPGKTKRKPTLLERIGFKK